MIKNYYKLIVALLFVTNVFGQNLPSYLPKNGLVGWWPFNGNANDESGNGNHGIVNGATLTSDRLGNSNSAFSFDGINNYIEIEDSKSNFFNSDFSISIWYTVNSKIESDERNLICKSEAAGPFDKLVLMKSDGLGYYPEGIGIITFPKLTENSFNGFLSCGNKILENEFHNLIVTQTSNKLKIYVDGVLKTTTLLTNKLNYIKASLLFGGDEPNSVKNDHFWHGILDDIAIYNRALTEHEITALYSGTPIAQNIPSYMPKDGLVGWWPFNGNANDESGNGNNGIVSGAMLTTDRNGKDNSAYSFDGKSSSITVNNSSSLTISKSITVGIWVKHNSPGSEILFRKGGSYTPSWSLNQEGRFLFYVHIGGWTNSGGGSTIPESNKWYFVVGTYDGFECNLYVNGKLEASNKLSGEFSLTNDLLYFGTDSKNNQWLNGNLSNGFIYNRALTEAEIQALYTGTPLCTTPPTPKVNPTVTTCAGNSISFEATGATVVETYNWYDVAEGGTPIATSQIFKTPVLNYGENKTYWVSITNGVCESTRARVDVVVKELPTVKKPENYSVCAGEFIQTINFAVSPQGATNYWSNDNLTIGLQKNGMGAIPGFKTPNNINTPIVSNITVTPSFNGCIGKSETFKIYVIPTPKVAITNLKPIVYTSDAPIALEGEPAGGTFTGEAIVGNIFTPAKTTLGKKSIEYKYVSKDGCGGSATASTIVVDTNGVVCTKYDTITVNKTIYDTITIKNNVYDTITVKETIYDTVLKITFKLTTGINISKTTSLSVYPNPTADNLIIDAADLAAMSGYRYKLLDAVGKEIYSQLVTFKKTEISLKTLGAKGVYVLHVLDANNQSVVSKKIVLE